MPRYASADTDTRGTLFTSAAAAWAPGTLTLVDDKQLEAPRVFLRLSMPFG